MEKSLTPGTKTLSAAPIFRVQLSPNVRGGSSAVPNFKWGKRTAFVLKSTCSFPSPCTFPTQRADKVSPIYFPRQLFLSIPESWVQISRPLANISLFSWTSKYSKSVPI